MNRKERVVVLGASNKPSRYSNMAIDFLLRYGHEPVPVHPCHTEILGVPVVRCLECVTGAIDTVTLYVSPQHLSAMVESVVALKPRRVIANPGAESEAMRLAVEEHGIQYLEACTLVMLSTGQF
jgi:predicted CoA-binding protein